MKTTVTIKSSLGSIVTISVEHDEPMTLSTEPDISTTLSVRKEENLDTPSENLDRSLKNLDTSLENQEEKPRCKWCGMTFEPKRTKNEKFCSENCRHEAKKDRDRIQKRLKSAGVSPLAARGQKIAKTPKQTTERTYEGKNCERCGRFYIPTGPRQQFCKPDCEPLTPEQQAELDNTLKQIEINKNKPVI